MLRNPTTRTLLFGARRQSKTFHRPRAAESRKSPSSSPVTLIKRTFTSTLSQRQQQQTSTGEAPAAVRDGKPFRVAIIGSGPAGFYTAYRVMTRVPGTKVDMFEALPVPFGLVRFGVAPDHPEVKKCQEKFEEVASSPDFTFLGNVTVGNSPQKHPHPATVDGHDGCTVPLPAVLRHYDAVVFAYGAARDRTLGIPGEGRLKGIYSAREFVGWYNGLPEYSGLAPDLTRGEEAVIIGQGNVALDVARMLLEDVHVLRKSDITEAAIETLSRSRIKRVHVVGRRGPMQAAFTIKEVRELMKLSNVGFHPIDMSLIPPEISKLPRPRRRLLEVLVKGSPGRPVTTTETSNSKSWSLDFCLSPTAFEGEDGDDASPSAGGGFLQKTIFERTSLASPFEPTSSVSSSSETTPPIEIPSSVAFRSIGYKSLPLSGFDDVGIAFDEKRGVIRNDSLGRVLARQRGEEEQAGHHLPGVYCAGWVKRGPTGVIASTMEDAFSTGDVISSDWLGGAAFLDGSGSSRNGWEGLRNEVNLDGSRVVQWSDWHKIDRAERERGSVLGKEREKFTSTTDMLAVAK